MPFECKVIAIGQLFGEFSVVGESEASFSLRGLAPEQRLIDLSDNESEREMAVLMTLEEVRAAVPTTDPLRQWLLQLPPHVSAIMVHFSEWNIDPEGMKQTKRMEPS